MSDIVEVWEIDQAGHGAPSARARTRTVLRQLLGARIGCAPADVAITVTSQGKPTLEQASGPHFNVSHAQGRSLVALAGRPVGVDIERTDRDVGIDGAVRLVLCPAEQDHLRQLGPDDRRRTFFSLWARKEAVSKGVGLGLGLPFPSIDARPPEVTVGASTWACSDFAVAPPYVAALAVPAPRPPIEPRTWS
jgi:4'-phosphopantetheinyl transferase